jgi:heat shock protein HslJ
MTLPPARSRAHFLAQTVGLALIAMCATACSPPRDEGTFNPKAAKSSTPVENGVKTDALLLQAGGDEPGWALTVMESGIKFDGDYGDLKFEGPLELTRPDPAQPKYTSQNKGQTLVADVVPGPCRSTMTGMPFQHNVTVTLGARTFKGCGGDPKNFLTGRRFENVSVAGHMGTGKMPSLVFQETEGSPLVVSGPCGRQTGSWQLTGEGLRFDMASVQAGITCSAADKASLTALTTALARVTLFDVTNEGAIVLLASDQRVVTLTQPVVVDTPLE